MADKKKETDGPSPFSSLGYDFLPDFDHEFVSDADLASFSNALNAPETSPSHDDLTAADGSTSGLFITALNDWRPVRQRVRKRKKRQPRRGKDETREGFVYTLLKWPLLVFVFGWVIFLGIAYVLTRLYIYLYEHWITWRGMRQRLRKKLNSTQSYEDWVAAAKDMDAHLGNDKWKKEDAYAYYDSKTIRRVRDQMKKLRQRIEAQDDDLFPNGKPNDNAIDELRQLVEASVKNNFVGFENPRLYSETYYGTKDLVQSHVDEVTASLRLLLESHRIDTDAKRTLFKQLHTNFGRAALCLSGGATFAYYHFGIAKALLDADLLPNIITGTSGGALVAALLCTRTNEELKQLLVPALANRITACHDPASVWARRWWKTGARFDSVDWARRCSWMTRGSLTFREAYARTGRILNVSCVPSDPHSPTILANYITSPDCVIWSAVLASAAVPGILNPVVLMKKNSDGTLAPYSFGHKWKDGSLRTDIPLKALNLHFNVNFTIVSQVNPHINLFFFSSRGSVGRPVTHRRGRGWRGGFLGSATEQYLKLDLSKWLKVLKHLELLPRPLGQDWSDIWLQRFSGTITIWPKSILSDFYYILSDPTPQRLARMIHVGQQAAWPKVKFIANRMKIEKVIDEGRRLTRGPQTPGVGLVPNVLSEDDLQGLLKVARRNGGRVAPPPNLLMSETSPGLTYNPADAPCGDIEKNTPLTAEPEEEPENRGRVWLDGNPPDGNEEGKADEYNEKDESQLPRPRRLDRNPGYHRPESPSMAKRLSGWFNALVPGSPAPPSDAASKPPPSPTVNRLPNQGQARKRSPYIHAAGDRPTSMFELGQSGELPDPNPSTLDLLRDAPAQLHRRAAQQAAYRRGSMISEIGRQSGVFFDDEDFDVDDTSSEVEEGEDDEDGGRGLDAGGLEHEYGRTWNGGSEETETEEEDVGSWGRDVLEKARGSKME